MSAGAVGNALVAVVEEFAVIVELPDTVWFPDIVWFPDTVTLPPPEAEADGAGVIVKTNVRVAVLSCRLGPIGPVI